MLVSFSTQCARAKRKGGALLILPVVAIEQAAAAIRAAEHTEHPLVIMVDATKPLLYGLDIFISTLLNLGRSSAVQITVGAWCGPTHVAAEQAFSAGAQFITPKQKGSREQLISLLSWSATRGAAQMGEVVVHPANHEHLESLMALIHDIPLAGLFLSDEAIRVNGVINASLIKEITTIAKLPLMVSFTEDPLPKEIQRSVQAGVNGFVIEEEFDQAFTAGVRAALHNRSQSDPLFYLSKGSLAVEEKMARYLESLCLI